ncbi:hypothetical protein HY772_01045 [Candidatus Woesearchaeota archaeon]|nr:hypothetical protein [Candidatus Woesearchaeota archaeon]
MSDQDLLFIQVHDPVALRRTLLGCSKQIVVLLQRYERFKTIRAKKLETIVKLRALNRDITLLMTKLHTYLPAAQTKLPEKHEQGKKHATQQLVAEKISVEHVTDLDKLEAELARIESKMKNIS